MTRTYENVGRAVRNRRTVSRRRRRSALTAAIVSAVMYVTGVFVIVMYARAVWFDTVGTELPPEPPSVSTHQPVQTPPPTGPASEEPVVESRYVLYDIQLSEELQHYTQDVCEEYGVSYPLVIAIMKKESEFRSDAVSATNDYGIMQINGGNHEWLEGALGITDWFAPPAEHPRRRLYAGPVQWVRGCPPNPDELQLRPVWSQEALGGRRLQYGLQPVSGRNPGRIGGDERWMRN